MERVYDRGIFMEDVDIWDLEFGELEIDRDLIQEFASRHRGSVRISMGLFCTKKEFEKEKKEVLSRSIP
jgi:hypothetical protein